MKMSWPWGRNRSLVFIRASSNAARCNSGEDRTEQSIYVLTGVAVAASELLETAPVVSV
jgi:hypothetical protein